MILSLKLLDLERKTSHEPTGWAICSRVVFTPPTPGRGEWGRFGQAQFSMCAKRKKTAKSCLHRFERKTRLEPALRVGNFSRTIFTPPNPWKGRLGVARSESRFLLQAKPPLSKGGLEGLSIWSRTLPRNAQKKDSLCYPSCVERKTRLELATPTLARLCSTN